MEVQESSSEEMCQDNSDIPVAVDVDTPYFASYEDLEVHRLMLSDRPRTEAYQKAILSNSKYFEGKIVMDVGAGTGILSLFCAKAGAKKVYAVEASGLALTIKEVVEKNGYSDIIEVIHGRAEDIELPEKVDVIVSEWMGFYLFHESMLDSVLAARDKHLSAEGIMLPSKAKLLTAACSLSHMYKEQVTFWDNQYGFDLRPVASHVLRSKTTRPEVLSLTQDDLLTEPVTVTEIDLAWVGIEEVQSLSLKTFTSIVSENPAEFQGVCLWFDCDFEVPDGETVTLSTAPSSPATHWKQSAIVLPTPTTVEEGDIVGWQLEMKQSADNKRHYVIELTLLDPENDEHPMPCSCGAPRCAIIAAYMKEEQDHFLEEGAEVIDIS